MQADNIGKDIAEKLNKVVRKIADEKDFKRSLSDNKESMLKGLGFKPQQISTFRLEKADRDSCWCECAPSKGWGKGCFIPNVEGAVSDP